MSVSEIREFENEQGERLVPDKFFQFVPKMLIRLRGQVLGWISNAGPYEVEYVEPVPLHAQKGMHGALHDQYVYIVIDGQRRKFSGHYCVPAQPTAA